MSEHVEPDYDTAAQAKFVLDLAMLCNQFRGEVFAVVEKYVHDREAELRANAGVPRETEF